MLLMLSTNRPMIVLIDDDEDRYEVTGADQAPVARRRIDVALVDVVDQVGRRRVDRRGKRGHERGEQAGEQQAQYPDRRELQHRGRQNVLEIEPAADHQVEFLVVDDRQHREAGDHQVTDRVERDRYEAAHHRRLARRAGRQDFLHVVVGSRPGGADQDALEQHHHEEDAEQRIAVRDDFAVDLVDDAAPVDVQRPAEKRIGPAGGCRRLQRFRRHVGHRDDRDDRPPRPP